MPDSDTDHELIGWGTFEDANSQAETMKAYADYDVTAL